MSMTEFVKIIEANGKGVRAYVACAQAARNYLKTKSDRSAAYFLLAIAADEFVDTYYDQPLLSQQAEDEFLRFKNYVEKLAAAQETDDNSIIMKTLNQIATDIANRKLNQSVV